MRVDRRSRATRRTRTSPGRRCSSSTFRCSRTGTARPSRPSTSAQTYVGMRGVARAVGVPRRRGRYGARRMALRDERGAGRRRARRGGPRVVLLALALYLAAGVLATRAGAARRADALPRPRRAAARRASRPATTCRPPTTSGCRATRSSAAARAVGRPVLVPARRRAARQLRRAGRSRSSGGRSTRVLDTVGAWNAFVLLTYVGAGGLAALWLRSLGLCLGAALVGGLAFALAPYRVAQSTGHLLGPISMLLPLSLWGAGEARPRAGSPAAAIASIPLSGQVHLALGAIPFFVAYACVRAGGGPRARGGRLAARRACWCGRRRCAARPSGRSRRSSATRPSSATSSRATCASSRRSCSSAGSCRSPRSPGWSLARARAAAPRRRARARRARPRCCSRWARTCPATGRSGSTRRCTPRACRSGCMPIACLALAALLAFAVERVPWRYAALVAAALVALDLRAGVELYDPLTAGEDDPAHAVLRTRGPRPLPRDPRLPPRRVCRQRLHVLRDAGAARAAARATPQLPRRRRRRSRSGSSGCSAAEARRVRTGLRRRRPLRRGPSGAAPPARRARLLS